MSVRASITDAAGAENIRAEADETGIDDFRSCRQRPAAQGNLPASRQKRSKIKMNLINDALAERCAENFTAAFDKHAGYPVLT